MKAGDKGCLWAVGIVIGFLVLLCLPSASGPKTLFTLAGISLTAIALVVAVLFAQAITDGKEPEVDPDLDTQEKSQMRKVLWSAALIPVAILIFTAASKITDTTGNLLLGALGLGLGLISVGICVSSGLEVLVIAWRRRKQAR